MFNEILELRVREATEDLREQLTDLRHSRADGAEDTYVTSQIGRIIDFIHSLRFDKGEPMEKAIGAFNRIARRLEALTEAAASEPRGPVQG